MAGMNMIHVAWCDVIGAGAAASMSSCYETKGQQYLHANQLRIHAHSFMEDYQ